MKLARFRVTNFRSINDSGWIDVVKTTAIVGRNESGKSNILLALASLNPPGGPVDLTLLKDFPRDRPRQEMTPETVVLETVWKLDAQERRDLEAMWARAVDVDEITISRGYSKTAVVHIPVGGAPEIPIADVKRKLRGIGAKVDVATDEDGSTPLAVAFEALKSAAFDDQASPATWGAAVASSARSFRKALAACSADLGSEDARLHEIEEMAAEQQLDEEASNGTVSWAMDRIPTMIYVEDHSPFDGHKDVQEFVNQRPVRPETESDRNFKKLCKVAGLVPAELLAADHENRMLMNNRAGALVTRRIRELWRDRQLKIRFNMDGPHFDTLVSDPNADYDVEVNLDERSRGLRWFFSFFITYLADTNSGPASNAILLLDEPGLFLHAGSQRDLLSFLKNDIAVQSIYTTHSPFMVPHDDLDAVRTVSIDVKLGTTVSNDPKGDAKTLFPIQAALGYDLSQSLFVGPRNLVVEGVTDFWIISAVSTYLREIGRVSLSETTVITPAGGAQKVPYMVTLLTSQKLNVVVLLDDEKMARRTGEDLMKSLVLNDRAIVYVSDAFDPAPVEADIEDLLDPAVFSALATESHADVLAGKTPVFNEAIPRIERRYDKAFDAVGAKFNKTRVARLFLRRMGEAPAQVLDAATLDRFERIFSKVNEKLA